MAVARVRTRVERWAAPLAGVLGVVATIAGLMLGDLPALDGRVNPTGSPATISRVVAEHSDRVRVGTTILMVGLFLLVWFLLHLRAVFGRDEGVGWEADVAVAGGLMAVTLIGLVVAIERAMLQLPAEETITKAWVVLGWDFWRTFAPFISAHLLAAGIAIVRTRALPRLIGWGAIAAAFIPLVVPPGFMTVVFLMWMLVIAGGLLIKVALRRGAEA